MKNIYNIANLRAMLNKNSNIKFITSAPTSIFTIENFFDKNFYDALNKNFPDFSSINLQKLNHGKFSLHSNSDEYRNVVFNNKVLTELHQIIFNESFVRKIYEILYLRILLSNKNNLLRIFKHFRIFKFQEYEKDKKKILDFFFKKIRIETEFSFMENEGKIVPHVDSISEIFSLLIFFPNLNKSDKFFENEKKYGTTFWESKDFNYLNRHLVLKEEEKTFKEKNKIIYKAPFIENFCCGFVRNDQSWHTVDPLNINKDYVRRSININCLISN